MISGESGYHFFLSRGNTLSGCKSVDMIQYSLLLYLCLVAMMVRYCSASIFNRNGFVEVICMPTWIILIGSQDYIYVYKLREHHTIVI